MYDAFNNTSGDLAPSALDLGVEDSALFTIEQLQKQVIDDLNPAFTKNEDVKEIFEEYDDKERGTISYKEFKNAVYKVTKEVSKMRVYFLAKRYCLSRDDQIQYKKFFDELEMVKKGVNPLMEFALDFSEQVKKTLYSMHKKPKIFFNKYADQHEEIIEERFMKAVKDLNLMDNFTMDQLKKYF